MTNQQETIRTLQAERDEAVKLMSQYAREAGEALGKLEMSEKAGIVEGWQHRCAKAEAERDAALERVRVLEAAKESTFIAGFNAGRRGDMYYGPAWLVHKSTQIVTFKKE